MPRHSTIPDLYDECKTITITKLREWGYLKSNQWLTGIVTWSRNGSKYASIGIAVNTFSEQPYIELDYKCNDEPVKYKVDLVSLPSNIGKGTVWYFRCPHTRKRCRKLYMIGKYFLHRTAFKGCFYEKQTQSKKYRALDQTLGECYRADELYSELYKKHFKKRYAGKPTKKYLQLMRQIERAESIPVDQLERVLLP